MHGLTGVSILFLLISIIDCCACWTYLSSPQNMRNIGKKLVSFRSVMRSNCGTWRRSSAFASNPLIRTSKCHSCLESHSMLYHHEATLIDQPLEPTNLRGSSLTIQENMSDPPVVSHVKIDPLIMSYLQLKPHLRKSRFLLSTKEEFPLTVEKLREMIEKRYPGLEKQPYRLQYLLYGEPEENTRTLTDDGELQRELKKASVKGRAFQLFVNCIMGQFPPPEFKLPLSADPRETESYTMVSFFSFSRIEDTNQTTSELQRMWTPFRALGRVYVANEGVNAQMAIPTNIFEDFKNVTKDNRLFHESRFNTDPAIPKEEYFKSKPFRALHIRIRDQIVADGLDEALNWKNAGHELDPMEWHKALDDPSAIILDCRNTYETDVGIFDGAIPLNTTFFRESWVALDEALKGKPKDTPVLTYCTGGIRCVKINAYLEQKMGFINTHRLKGGVIAYRRELEEQRRGRSDNVSSIPSKFKGVNYVFDERIVERITEDCVGKCESCGTPNDSFTNCKNVNCNVRFIQCTTCRGAYHNCCSLACKLEFDLSEEVDRNVTLAKLSNWAGKRVSQQLRNRINFGATMLSRTQEKTIADAFQTERTAQKSHAISDDILQNAIGSYCEQLSENEPRVLKTLREETLSTFPLAASRMLSGPSQGALLSLLATLNNAKVLLELGTFTGYSAICLAMNYDAFSSKQQSKCRVSDRKVYTCEIEPKAFSMAERSISNSQYNNQIVLKKFSAQDMLNYAAETRMKFDMVFIDADKRNYLNYLKILLGSTVDSTLLNPGALVVVDNTLWKGLVLNQIPELKNVAPNADEFGPADRFNKISDSMHTFNRFCVQHPDLRCLLLPMRDGLTVLRYSPRIE